MPRIPSGASPKALAYAEPVDPANLEGKWRCKVCGQEHANRGAVQLHQRTHKQHAHTFRLLRSAGREAMAIEDGWTQVCTGCGDLA